MLDKLKKFYLKLPNEVLEVCLNGDYNRITRRKLKTYKKIETKVGYILKDDILHKMFIDYLYDQYDFVNDISSDVNKIINTINNDNFIQYMIFMLKNFYSNNNLKEYVLSNLFDEHLQKFMNTNKEIRNNDIKSSEENDNKYIVNIKEENGYYNIYPLLKFKDNKLLKVSKEDYPTYGNININPYLEFSKKNYDIISSLWICKFNQSELEEIENRTKPNGESRTKFKINGDKLIRNKSIYSINEVDIYEIAELIQDSDDIQSMIHKEKIQIKNKPISENVYIKDNDYIYGPFGYEDNNRGGGYYLDK